MLFCWFCFFCFFFAGKTQTQYKEILVSNNIVWALTSDGNIKSFDTQSGKQIDKNVFADTGIILITKDKTGNLATTNKHKQIKKYDQNKMLGK